MKRPRNKTFQFVAYNDRWSNTLAIAAQKAGLSVSGYLKMAATAQMRRDGLEPMPQDGAR